MKQKTSSSTGSKKVALVIIAATIGFLILTPIILVRQAERQRMRIYQIDPGTLLVACRTLIAEKAGHHAIANAMTHMTTEAPELERLDSERRAEARRSGRS
jgi:hypothetical protein